MAPPRSLASVVIIGLGLLLAAPAAQAQDASPSPTALPSPGLLRPLALEPDGLPPLEGTTWRLVAHRRREMRTVGPEIAAWMTLRGGQLRGSTSCGRLSGRYGDLGIALAVRPTVAKGGRCPKAAARVATSLASALEDASRFEIAGAAATAGAELIVRDADGREDLRFALDDAADLAAGDWELQGYSVAGQSMAADPLQTAVLAFRPTRDRELQRRSSGDIIGSTGCNGIVGRFRRQADVLTFPSLERTEAPCSTALAAQEAAIMAVLESPALTVDLPLDRLVLESATSGDRLEFVSATPLEGTTWLLSGLADVAAGGGTVTLRLASGLLSGEGPCGPFSGRYVADGVFLTTADVHPAGMTGCAREAEHRALLDALRQWAMLERDGPDLRLLDARGGLLATFAPAGAM
jgi:heat shock protein HslJ